MFIGMKHISPTFRYTIAMYLRLTTFTKTLPQCHFKYFFAIFLRSGTRLITLLTAGALTDIQLPATPSNVCTTDARLGGVDRVPPPPNKNLGYAGVGNKTQHLRERRNVKWVGYVVKAKGTLVKLKEKIARKTAKTRLGLLAYTV